MHMVQIMELWEGTQFEFRTQLNNQINDDNWVHLASIVVYFHRIAIT